MKGERDAQAFLVRRSLSERLAGSVLFWLASVLLIATNSYLLACPPHWG